MQSSDVSQNTSVTNTSEPQARSVPRGLVTVALLKARFDEGVDHADMFMPLVIDTIDNMPSASFTCAEVQEVLGERHGLAMPQHTLTTLLKRATRKGFAKREFSRYKRVGKANPSDDLSAKKASIEGEQKSLAQAFRGHAAKKGQTIGADDDALKLILGFLEENQVAMLLGAEDSRTSQPTVLTSRESRLVADFARSIISDNSDFARTLKGILEGLVVYNAAFLKDITSPAHQFKRLRAFFDTRILLQLLGYEGEPSAVLAREALQLLRTSGVQCLAFDKTIFECRGILNLYERKLATTKGVSELHPNAMSRYLLKKHFTPSDLRQMSALLPQELDSLGIQIFPQPRHIRQYTLDEKKLAQALADESTGDSESPRVLHDVDCIAGILTLRRGERFLALSEMTAIFVTSTYRVLGNIQRWFEEQGETGIGPAIHIRALTNLVWLRRPALSVNLKAHELIAMCNAALQPSRKTWARFLEHLHELEASKSITTDEAVAIVVSELTDELLAAVDDSAVDEDDNIDASTLDEIIDRVRSSYEADATRRIEQYQEDATQRIAEAETHAARREEEANKQVESAQSHAHSTAENYRRLKLSIESKAVRVSRILSGIVAAIIALPVVIGAIALIFGHPIGGGVLSKVIGFAIMTFVIAELVGVLHHIASLRYALERLIVPRLRRAFGADTMSSSAAIPSILGLDSHVGEDSELED